MRKKFIDAEVHDSHSGSRYFYKVDLKRCQLISAYQLFASHVFVPNRDMESELRFEQVRFACSYK